MDSLEALKEKFGDKIKEIYEHNPRRFYIYIDKENLPDVARFLYDNYQGRLATASGTDTRTGIEIVYHFMIASEHRFMNLKVKLAKPFPEVPSLAPWLKAANWIERELYDMLGVKAVGHPDPRRLLLSDDWPDGQFPLRRDFKFPEKRDFKGADSR
jgi:Ni,Fe-hydrogenase III component G